MRMLICDSVEGSISLRPSHSFPQSTITLASGNMVRFGIIYSLGNFTSMLR